MAHASNTKTLEFSYQCYFQVWWSACPDSQITWWICANIFKAYERINSQISWPSEHDYGVVQARSVQLHTGCWGQFESQGLLIFFFHDITLLYPQTYIYIYLCKLRWWESIGRKEISWCLSKNYLQEKEETNTPQLRSIT